MFGATDRATLVTIRPSLLNPKVETMARRGGPALYELLGNRRDTATGGSLSQRTHAPRAVLDPSQVRSLVTFIIVLVLVIGAYLVGVSRGERLGREGIAQERAEEMRLLEEGRPSGSGVGQPNNTVSADSAGSGISPPIASENALARVTNDATTSATTGALAPTAIGVDPREAGKNYFVLGSVLAENASRLVAFCRERGLDAWVVPDHNGRLREIIVLPGYASGERESVVISELEARIRKVGVLFKASGGGTDFGDKYPKLFKG